MTVQFEWDSNKETANRRKHGVSFEEAKTVFFDRFGVDRSSESLTRGPRPHPREGAMKKTRKTDEYEMKSEYDFTGGIRGKYFGVLTPQTPVRVRGEPAAVAHRDNFLMITTPSE